MTFYLKRQIIYSIRCILQCRLQNGGHFILASLCQVPHYLSSMFSALLTVLSYGSSNAELWYIFVVSLNKMVKNSQVAGHLRCVMSLQWMEMEVSWDFVMFVLFNMMTSSNANIFRVIGHLCGEFTGRGHRWIPRTTANDVGLWCFLWSAPE